ncbi:MAG: cytochrome c [Acidobacteriota bacterium]
MVYVKISLILLFVAIFADSCSNAASSPTLTPEKSVIADNKSYEASLFRQNCAICHGPEANGKTLDGGKVIPSLRTGAFKFTTDEQIYNQIANGGNGMVPFRGQLTDREIKLLVNFVRKDLRHSQ